MLSLRVPKNQAAPKRPVRTVEEWRPPLLLCKRFNVPDPYKGRPAPVTDPAARFKSDRLALPETAAAASEAARQLPGPPPGPPPAAAASHVQPMALDNRSAADAFLDSLADDEAPAAATAPAALPPPPGLRAGAGTVLGPYSFSAHDVQQLLLVMCWHCLRAWQGPGMHAPTAQYFPPSPLQGCRRRRACMRSRVRRRPCSRPCSSLWRSRSICLRPSSSPQRTRRTLMRTLPRQRLPLLCGILLRKQQVCQHAHLPCGRPVWIQAFSMYS